MNYEAEENAGQAEYNRLHLHKERDRMMRIINAYKKLNQYTFLIHAHFVSMFLFFRFYFNLNFALCKHSSTNILQIIAILKQIYYFWQPFVLCSKFFNFSLCTAYCKLEKLQYISATLPLRFCKIHTNILQSITPLCVMTILIFLLCNTTKNIIPFVFYFVLLQNIYKGYSIVGKVLQYFFFRNTYCNTLLYFANYFQSYRKK